MSALGLSCVKGDVTSEKRVFRPKKKVNIQKGKSPHRNLKSACYIT